MVIDRQLLLDSYFMEYTWGSLPEFELDHRVFESTSSTTPPITYLDKKPVRARLGDHVGAAMRAF